MKKDVEKILNRLRNHDFHPIKDGFTYDKHLDEHGVADLTDDDWSVRTYAVRDLVTIGKSVAGALIEALDDKNKHVRHVAAKVLGLFRSDEAVGPLCNTLLKDNHEVVRAQAAVSLWQIGDRKALETVKTAWKQDESKDVRHQAELAKHALQKGVSATKRLQKAYQEIEEKQFNSIEIGKKAPDFTLRNTEGEPWKLYDHLGEQPLVLIWIFADWCPVCHNEFSELIEMRDELEGTIQFVTLECHDLYPARVMVGKEFEPEYWFSEESFYNEYTRNIWWPHLSDPAALVGMQYGVQPMAFTVHAEWINRPAVVIIDEGGIVRFTYYGSFWGDRPSIQDIKAMIVQDEFQFEHEDKLEVR